MLCALLCFHSLLLSDSPGITIAANIRSWTTGSITTHGGIGVEEQRACSKTD